MHIVYVSIQVKKEYRIEFVEATIENVRNSLQEEGVVRFDFLQKADDACSFVLYEVYRSPDDQKRHRETTHYQIWRDQVQDMMAEPRSGKNYVNIFPEDSMWKKNV